MGLWIARPPLRNGEGIRWKTSANRVLSPRMTSGGRLIVTDQRVFFHPIRIDTMLGRKIWECPLDAVTGFEPISRDRAILAGGLRERLGVRTIQGTEIFVVNHLQEKIAQLEDLFPQGGTMAT